MLFLVPESLQHQSGIYIIRNVRNKRVYIGSAKQLKRRFQTHCQELRKGTHHSQPLQNFANKYGIEALQFELIATCELDVMLKYEQLFIDAYRSSHRDFGFNICSIAGSCKGITKSAEHREKLKAAATGRKLSPETIAKRTASRQQKGWQNDRPKGKYVRDNDKYNARRRAAYARLREENPTVPGRQLLKNRGP